MSTSRTPFESPLHVQLRPGRLRDRSAVAEFTQNTFHWGDYISQSWSRWVRDPSGKLIVAEAAGQVVGTLHVAFLGESEAWLEGMRVRPEFRGHGIASLLDPAGRDIARQAGCRLIRLETWRGNTAVRRAMVKFGYSLALQFESWAIPAAPRSNAPVRLATADDLRSCWTLWRRSWLREASRSLLPAYQGWRWWTLSRTRLADGIRRRMVWVTPRDGKSEGFMVLRRDDSLDVIALVGEFPAAAALVQGAQNLAARRRAEKVFWLAPRSPLARRWARKMGMSLDDEGMLIYEQALHKR